MGVATSNRRLLSAGVALWVILVAILVWRQWPEPPPPRQAANLLRTAVAGDAARVASSVPELDLSRMGISRTLCERLVREIVLPPFTACKLRAVEELDTGNTNFSGAAMVTLILPSGAEAPMAMQVERSDTGMVVPLEGWLRQSWRLRYYSSHPKAGLGGVTPMLWGLRATRKSFEELGITKIACLDGRVRTLDELDAFFSTIERKQWPKGD